ncbi:MAG TPA: bifunctional pyr operon transcriptional regulator/uracil phosphoribosyltransferase PyrR [Saprospiraceae bacterium]|nr:bifunctional pyr operon transcriptional regulator/uracil phosphoribosyltransferase PyrR [Saprospiraceae bacterium]
MIQGREIINSEKFEIILRRLCHQIIEEYKDFSDTCIIGLQPRGSILSDCIVRLLRDEFKIQIDTYGKIDITFYRDDYRNRDTPLRASPTHMNFIVDGKKVLLIDDVLFTGRSVHAAIAALQDYGRPSNIELLAFIDRRFNREFPIQADFLGISVDALDEAYVKVKWNEALTSAQVFMFPQKPTV